MIHDVGAEESSYSNLLWSRTPVADCGIDHPPDRLGARIQAESITVYKFRIVPHLPNVRQLLLNDLYHHERIKENRISESYERRLILYATYFL